MNDDGVTLKTALHPIGKPVPEDAEPSEESLIVEEGPEMSEDVVPLLGNWDLP